MKRILKFNNYSRINESKLSDIKFDELKQVNDDVQFIKSI